MDAAVTQRILIILNDPPYGTERSYNGLRLTNALGKGEAAAVRVFLMADAVACAKQGQITPNGYYNLERMVKLATKQGTVFGACGTCLDARGMAEEQLAEGVRRSSMDELSEWTLWAGKVIVF